MSRQKLQVEELNAAGIRRELQRVRHRSRYLRVLVSTLSSLLTIAAIAVLLATLFFPVMRIWGSSMTPTLHEGQIVVSIKGSDFDTGDIIAFHYNNKVLIKRVIAGPGQWVNITEDGNVYVDDIPLEEPYVSELSLGESNLEYPYQVPDGRFFVMGDHRATSVDSRNTAVGCVGQEQLVGKIVLCVWPLGDFGTIPGPAVRGGITYE